MITCFVQKYNYMNMIGLDNSKYLYTKWVKGKIYNNYLNSRRIRIWSSPFSASDSASWRLTRLYRSCITRSCSLSSTISFLQFIASSRSFWCSSKMLQKKKYICVMMQSSVSHLIENFISSFAFISFYKDNIFSDIKTGSLLELNKKNAFLLPWYNMQFHIS